MVNSGLVKPVNGWGFAFKGFGNPGTDYELRAFVAYLGLGANKYVMHFAKGQIPPVNAFWSLTMYNEGGYFIANPINRYTI
jgi:hypothetical protein